MTYYDAAMAGVIIAGMIWGALRGITWQIASIASLVLGYTVAHPLSTQLAPSFPGEPVVARALAMMVIYAAVSGGVFLAAWLIRATLRKLQFEAYDRHLGMVLGGLEGALIGLVATFFVVSLAPQTRGPIFSSPSGKIVGDIMETLGPVLPTEARNVLNRFWDGNNDSSADQMAASDKTSDKASAPKPANGDATSFQGFLEKEESKISRAIVDTAKQELQSAGTGDADGRTVERR